MNIPVYSRKPLTGFACCFIRLIWSILINLFYSKLLPFLLWNPAKTSGGPRPHCLKGRVCKQHLWIFFQPVHFHSMQARGWKKQQNCMRASCGVQLWWTDEVANRPKGNNVCRRPLKRTKHQHTVMSRLTLSTFSTGKQRSFTCVCLCVTIPMITLKCSTGIVLIN